MSLQCLCKLISLLPPIHGFGAGYVAARSTHAAERKLGLRGGVMVCDGPYPWMLVMFVCAHMREREREREVLSSSPL